MKSILYLSILFLIGCKQERQPVEDNYRLKTDSTIHFSFQSGSSHRPIDNYASLILIDTIRNKNQITIKTDTLEKAMVMKDSNGISILICTNKLLNFGSNNVIITYDSSYTLKKAGYLYYDNCTGTYDSIVPAINAILTLKQKYNNIGDTLIGYIEFRRNTIYNKDSLAINGTCKGYFKTVIKKGNR